ncbi:hypothetical protein [Streptomyces sp. NPDC002156]
MYAGRAWKSHKGARGKAAKADRRYHRRYTHRADRIGRWYGGASTAYGLYGEYRSYRQQGALLAFARGDRREAADAAAESDRAVTRLLGARPGPGKIRTQEAHTVWSPASDALGLRSWLWFTMAVVLGVGGLLITLIGPTTPQYVRCVIAFLPSVPSALFASWQIGHAALERCHCRLGAAVRTFARTLPVPRPRPC